MTHPEPMTDRARGREARREGGSRTNGTCAAHPTQHCPQPPWLGLLCSSETGPAFARAATGFSSLTAQSRPAFQISQASHSPPVPSSEPRGPAWLPRALGHPLAPSLTPKSGLATWPGPGRVSAGSSSEGLLPVCIWGVIRTLPAGRAARGQGPGRLRAEPRWGGGASVRPPTAPGNQERGRPQNALVELKAQEAGGWGALPGAGA